MKDSDHKEKETKKREYGTPSFRYKVLKPYKSCGVKDCFHCRFSDCIKG